MSVLDELQTLEERVRERLQQLQPLVEEYRELEKVAERIGVEVKTEAGKRPATGSRQRTRKSSSSRTGSSRNGRSRQASARRSASRGSARKAGTRRRSSSQTGASRGKAGQTNAGGGGERASQLTALVSSRPGITVREAGEELGVNPTYLYRVIRRLEKSGELKKQGRELQPA